MLKRAIATRYAKALFELGKDKGILEEIEADFPKVAAVIDGNEDAQSFLAHPAIGDEEKKKLIADLFKSKINDSLFDLLCLCVDKNREAYIGLIWQDFKTLLMEHRSQVTAIVYTPYELSPGLKKELEDRMSKSINKTVLLEEVVDKELIGGVRVKIGDRIYDGSVVSKIEQLREAMLSASV